MRVLYCLFHQRSYPLIGSKPGTRAAAKSVKRHFNCPVFCFSQIRRKGSGIATASLTQQQSPQGLDRAACSHPLGRHSWDGTKPHV